MSRSTIHFLASFLDFHCEGLSQTWPHIPCRPSNRCRDIVLEWSSMALELLHTYVISEGSNCNSGDVFPSHGCKLWWKPGRRKAPRIQTIQHTAEFARHFNLMLLPEVLRLGQSEPLAGSWSSQVRGWAAGSWAIQVWMERKYMEIYQCENAVPIGSNRWHLMAWCAHNNT